MTETNRKEPNPTRVVEVGEIFKPFEGMKFPDIELDQEDYQSLLESPISFSGINGKLRITTDPKAMFTAWQIATPLGKVRSAWEIDGDERKIIEVALNPDIQFFLTDFAQVKFLDDYALELKLYNNNFYILFGIDDNDVNKRDFGREKNVGVGYYDGTDSCGNEIVIALPYDIEKIRQIQARIVKRASIKIPGTETN